MLRKDLSFAWKRKRKKGGEGDRLPKSNVLHLKKEKESGDRGSSNQWKGTPGENGGGGKAIGAAQSGVEPREQGGSLILRYRLLEEKRKRYGSGLKGKTLGDMVRTTGEHLSAGKGPQKEGEVSEPWL